MHINQEIKGYPQYARSCIPTFRLLESHSAHVDLGRLRCPVATSSKFVPNSTRIGFEYHLDNLFLCRNDNLRCHETPLTAARTDNFKGQQKRKWKEYTSKSNRFCKEVRWIEAPSTNLRLVSEHSACLRRTDYSTVYTDSVLCPNLEGYLCTTTCASR